VLSLPSIEGWFAGLIVFQLVSVTATATLYLPTINADLIDNGLLRTDVGYIWTAGGWMVVVSVVQVLAAAISAYAGTRAATTAGPVTPPSGSHRWRISQSERRPIRHDQLPLSARWPRSRLSRRAWRTTVE